MREGKCPPARVPRVVRRGVASLWICHSDTVISVPFGLYRQHAALGREQAEARLPRRLRDGPRKGRVWQARDCGARGSEGPAGAGLDAKGE